MRDIKSYFPTMEVYENQKKNNMYNIWSNYSTPEFLCPKCNDGVMFKEHGIVCSSIPPKYMYKCDNCDNVEYLTF